MSEINSVVQAFTQDTIYLPAGKIIDISGISASGVVYHMMNPSSEIAKTSRAIEGDMSVEIGPFSGVEKIVVTCASGQIVITEVAAELVKWSGSGATVLANGNKFQQFPSAFALPKWRAGVAKVRAGTASVRAVVAGSSTAAGHGAGTRPFGLTARLTQMLNSYFVPASSNSIFGGSFGSLATLTSYDSRISFGTGWVASTDDGPLGSFSFKMPPAAQGGNTTGLLQFTPTDQFNILDLYVRKSPGAGTISISVDGGTTQLASSGSGADEMAFIRIQGSIPLGNYTITIKATSLGTEGVEVYMIRPWNTLSRSVDVMQWAHTGGSQTNFLTDTKPWSAYNAMNRIAPELVMFIVASNVWTGNQSMRTFTKEMESLTKRVKETSDFILIGGIPTPPTTVALNVQQKYIDATQEIAAENGVLFIDNWRRFLAQLDQPNDQNGLKFDFGHLNGPGYADFATPIYRALTEV